MKLKKDLHILRGSTMERNSKYPMRKARSLISIALFMSIVGALFYIMNVYTPLISDDYLYSFYLTPVAAKSFFEGTFVGFEQKILSLTDVLSSQYNHYFYVNGRTVPHIIEQIFAGIIGKEWFNVFNLFFFLSLTMLVVWIADRRKIFMLPYWVIGFSLLWLLLPHPADIILPMVCAINYVWSAVLCLVFLVFYFKIREMVKVHWLITIVLLLLGIIAGWTHEALAIGISGALFIDFCMHNKRKAKVSEILMIGGFWIGTLLICLSPAARGRAFLDHPSLWTTFLMIMGELRAFYFLLSLLGLVLLFKVKDCSIATLKKIICDNQFYFYIILIDFAFSLFIGYRNVRQLFGMELFSIILSMRLIVYLASSTSLYLRLSCIIAGVIVIIHMASIIPYSKCSYMQSQNIIAAYVQSEDGAVSYEKKSFPYLLDSYIWRFGEYLDWECSCISVYYTGNKKTMKIKSKSMVD